MLLPSMRFSPVPGNGSSIIFCAPNSAPGPGASVVVYASHRPSGDSTAFRGIVERTSEIGAAFMSFRTKLQSDTLEPTVTSNSNRSFCGDHESGTWDTP